MNRTIINQFPSLQRKIGGKGIIFLDGPAGTQVPDSVIDAISQYYKMYNANTHGAFTTTKETDLMMDSVREKMAIFLNAPDRTCISLGQNMTTLNFSLSKGIGRFLSEGDKILISQLDHESNRGPWLALQEYGIEVEEIKLLSNGRLDYKDLKAKCNAKTKLVAIGMASNFSGTVNDITLARKISYECGAWLLLDAVHYAPHFPIDVQQIGCDFLLCSAYKFYGPHVGILYSKPGLLDRLHTDRLRTADQHAPFSIETGTLNHAAMAGVGAAVDFIASFGKKDSFRNQIMDAFKKIQSYEKSVAQLLLNYIQKSRYYQLVGYPYKQGNRTPTISFTAKTKTAAEVCKALAEDNIFAWDGHFYAVRASEVLGLEEKGGVTRMGISIYTTKNDIKNTIKALDKIAKS